MAVSRITINLASDPFRRDRPIIAAGIFASVLLLGTLGLFAWLTAHGRTTVEETQRALERARARAQAQVNEQARLEATLRRPENAEVLERSVFLNLLLLRKGISWTQLFSDLEAVMPHDVRLISVRPQVFGQNEVLLDMVVGSKSSEPVIQMLMRLEASPVFGATAVTNSLPPSLTDPLYRYRVNVNYAQKP
jgi:hypothetical protein